MHSFVFDNLSEGLPTILGTLLNSGTEIGSRLGETTKELLHCHIELTKPWQREIMTPVRKASLPAQIAETMWVLSGRNDIGWLSHYLPRAADFSDDGVHWRGGYGPRIRRWFSPRHGTDHDQLAWLVDLLRREPGTRRAVVQIFDPSVDQEPGKDIPCNNWLHFISRDGRLDLHVAVRSNDALWGLSGINAFEWSALLEIVAGMTGLEVGSLHFSTTSLHLYDRHFAKARQIVDASRVVVVHDPRLDSPRFDPTYSTGLHDMTMGDLDELFALWFEAEEKLRNGESYPVADFPEPMLRSWLAVIAYHWSMGAEVFARIPEFRGTRLAEAFFESPKRKRVEQTPEGPSQGDFAEYWARVHKQKNAAYGSSWRRRGEMLGIMANIARKLDRLAAGTSTPDETQADTAGDLLVYLVKYELWLVNAQSSDDPEAVAHRLADWTPTTSGRGPNRVLIENLNSLFSELEALVMAPASRADYERKLAKVTRMIGFAVILARRAWDSEAVWTTDVARKVWQA